MKYNNHNFEKLLFGTNSGVREPSASKYQTTVELDKLKDIWKKADADKIVRPL